ncbi:MAG TPA: hypothetical protein VGN54_05495, partial [Mycobacteriales bacterium]|nr:hypothetical protein [Mycobacteriales bacterium]
WSSRLRLPDVLLALIAAAGVLLVHDLGYLLQHPYWLDEAWVVDSTRVRLSDLSQTSSVTPVGFSLLLRLVVFGGEQRQRLIPLAFAGLTVALAYLCGRQFGLRRGVSLLLLGVTGLFVPAMLVRADLKQYTAEACWTVLVLLLLLRLESVWSRRRLALLAAVIGVGPLFANADLFVGSAALLALAVLALAERQWSRLRDIVIAAGAAGVVVAAILAAFVLPKQNAALRHYWDAFYLPRNPSAAAHFLYHRLQAMAPTTGLHSVLLVFLGCALGTGVLVWRRRRATALVLPLAFAELVLASALHVYPLLDLRTSTWLSVLAVVVTGLGVAQLCAGLGRRHRAVPIILAGVASAGFALTNTTGVRAHPLPPEDVRAQAHYVADHQRPADVVIVDLSANWGYAYYRGIDPLSIVDSGPASATGFFIRYTDPQVVAMHSRTQASPAAALRTARSRLGPGGRIFVVRSHLAPAESAGWQQALAGQPVTTLNVGPEPLLVVPGATP